MATDHRGDVGGVKSVGRALDVLDALAGSEEQLGISELSATTKLPSATVHRLLCTLVDRGYVRQDPVTRRYMLGARLMRLGSPAGRLLGAWVTPLLGRLVSATGETANLAVLGDDQVVYIAQTPSPHRMRLFTEVGNRVPVHSTAVGKVLLAFRPRRVAAGVVDRQGLPARTSRTITHAGAFTEELERVVAQGYALDDEEEEDGVRCVAVPVFGIGDGIAAMSLSGPASRFNPGGAQAWVVPLMLRVAAEITEQMMGEAPPFTVDVAPSVADRHGGVQREGE